MSLKRWTYHDDTGHIPDEVGEWTRYKDVQHLEAENAELESQLGKAIAEFQGNEQRIAELEGVIEHMKSNLKTEAKVREDIHKAGKRITELDAEKAVLEEKQSRGYLMDRDTTAYENHLALKDQRIAELEHFIREHTGDHDASWLEDKDA